MTKVIHNPPLVILLMVLCLPRVWAGGASATLPEEVASTATAREVLDQHFIHVHGAGQVKIPYTDALTLLGRDDLLGDIQTAYQVLLGEGETPEFEIKRTEANHYSYTNRKQQTTRIVEMTREVHADGHTDVVLYSEGRRSFGDFKSLTHVRVKACREVPENSLWEVNVYAYPENSFSRFFARNLGIAQRYFRSKTAEISELAVEICMGVLQGADPAP